MKIKKFKRDYKSINYLVILLLILVLALIIRLKFFVGFGLGDDPYYAYISKNFLERGFSGLNPIGSNFRIGIWIPVSISYKLFGINDFSYVLFPLLCSLGSVITLYFIGKELFNQRVGAISAFLLAINPFDAVFASTMTIDIPVAFLSALSLLFFIKGDKTKNNKFFLYYFLSAFFLVFAYTIKIPAMFMIFVFITISLIKLKSYKKHFFFYLFVSIFVLTSFYIDYIISCNVECKFFERLPQQLKASPSPLPFKYLWSVYPKWMFGRELSFGILLFGYQFYLAVPAFFYCITRNFNKSYYIILWFIVLFILLEFFPLELSPLKIAPRFFRYTYTFLLPSILMSSIILSDLWNFHSKYLKFVLSIFFIIFVCLSLNEGYTLANIYQDTYQDSKEAAMFLAKLPEKDIYSDYIQLNRFNFYTNYQRMHQVKWSLDGIEFQRGIIEAKNYQLLKNISNAYVVVGGARGPDYGLYSIFNLGDFQPPENWRLIWELDKPINKYRLETLKIFEVS